MLFRDNLVIRLALVYRLKEKLRFLFPTFNFVPFISRCEKKKKSTFSVCFREKKEFQVTYLCEESIKLQTFS